MEPIRILKAAEPHPDADDIEVYGLDEWLIPAPSKLTDDEGFFIPQPGLQLIPLGFKSWHPWDALEDLDIVICEVVESCTYFCPITERAYTACVPFAILCRDIEKYLARGDWREWTPRMVRDQEFVQDRLYLRRVTTIQTLILGSGYTSCIMPNDGASIVRTAAALDLGDGDVVLVKYYEWSNK